jgi:hypothetical protein
MLTVHDCAPAGVSRGHDGFDRAPVPGMDDVRLPIPYNANECGKLSTTERTRGPDARLLCPFDAERMLVLFFYRPDAAKDVFETIGIEPVDQIRYTVLQSPISQVVEHVENSRPHVFIEPQRWTRSVYLQPHGIARRRRRAAEPNILDIKLPPRAPS